MQAFQVIPWKAKPEQAEEVMKKKKDYLLKQHMILKNLRESNDMQMIRNRYNLFKVYTFFKENEKALFYLEKAASFASSIDEKI